MMTLYLITPAVTPMVRQGKDPGWRHRSPDREGKKQAWTLAKLLKGKGIERIYCSDVHLDTGRILKSCLDVPLTIDEALRPFNLGMHAGKSKLHVDEVMQAIVTQWQRDENIPVRGGDSWSSYRKRFMGRVERILGGSETAVLVADPRNMRVLRIKQPRAVSDDGAIRPDRIYIIRREVESASQYQPYAPVDSEAARPRAG